MKLCQSETCQCRAGSCGQCPAAPRGTRTWARRGHAPSQGRVVLPHRLRQCLQAVARPEERLSSNIGKKSLPAPSVSPQTRSGASSRAHRGSGQAPRFPGSRETLARAGLEPGNSALRAAAPADSTELCDVTRARAQFTVTTARLTRPSPGRADPEGSPRHSSATDKAATGRRENT